MTASTLCRSCGAVIWWAITEAGKTIPVDDPDGDGNLAVWRDGGKLRSRALKPGEEPGEGQYRGRSHFASCPSADAHRKKRTKEDATNG